MRISFICLALMILASIPPANAATFEDGLTAYRSGDTGTAISIWTPLAEEGHLESQIKLGKIYLKGLDGTPDYEKARHWFRLAASSGNAEGETLLGFLLINEASDFRWPDRAYSLFNSAISSGHVPAIFGLGKLYQKGWGVIQSTEAAFMYYMDASAQGYPEAQYELALMQLHGQGTVKNLSLAHLYLTLAASQNHQKAAQLLKSVETKLAQPQIDKNRGLVNIWRSARGYWRQRNSEP